MNYFRRILPYVYAQYKQVALSVLCAFLAAVLFSASLGAMLPLMKVMIGEEGIHGWIARSIVKHRTGIVLQPLPVRENISAGPVDDSLYKLQVVSIERDGAAFQQGLLAQDTILAASWADSRTDEGTPREDLLQWLSQVEPVKVQLLVQHPNEQRETIAIDFAPQPWYAHILDRILKVVPKGQGPEFKRNSIIFMILVMLGATILRCLLRFVQEYLVSRIAFRSVMRLRLDAYRNVIRLPLSYFSTEGVSDTISRFVQDSSQVHMGISTVFGKMVREPFKIICLAALALKINAGMTLIALMIAPVAGIIIGKLGRKMKRATRRTLESWSRLLGRLQESLLGIRVVKGYHQEDFEQQFLERVNTHLLRQQNRMAKIDSASGPMLEALGMTAASLGMIFAAYWLTSDRMVVSDFIALVTLLGAIAESGRKLGNVLPRLQTANAAAERVYKLIDTPTETDPPHAQTLKPLSGCLEMRHINFTYPGSLQPTLQDINLTVTAGETIAVVGPNGSGKTTLLSLIPRFYIPESGDILIDGVNTDSVTLASLRGQLGIVTQQTVMFNDTIRANIAYGCPDADEQRILNAARQAFADEFITQTPKGYDTIIGEQGARLSGGQLQRLAIARAILRNPAILIFDEAMSQIDSDSEAKIQKTLAGFSRGRTSFIIAHRLSTIVNADRIVVLDQGRLLAQGKHEQLLNHCHLYRQLYEMQFVAAAPAS